MRNNPHWKDWLAPFLIEPIADLSDDLPLAGLSLNSATMAPNNVFVALEGKLSDGRAYVDEAVHRGAALILVDQASPQLTASVPVVRIAHLKRRLGAIASRFYGDPSAKLSVIAITGTSGKTSICQLLSQALWLLNKPCATIGTLGMGFEKPHYEGGLTTPDAITIQKNLALFLEQGADYVAIEASSHALDQGRLNALKIDTAIFSNLTQDHLDYHGTIEHYGAAKARLFQWADLKWAIINDDDSYATLLKRVTTADEVIRYGLEKGQKTQVYPLSAQYPPQGIEALLHTPWGKVDIQSTLLGKHNLSNLLSIVAHLGSHGIPVDTISRVIAQLKPISGRLERYGGGDSEPLIFVDFAHKPDAVQQTVQTLKAICRGRLWCIVGCGGNRDTSKRPLMAKAACGADVVVLSSDNPRDEEPEAIIADMKPGLVEGVETHIIVSRHDAIEYAVLNASENDMILVAGRGDETHQIIKGEKIPFNDGDVVEQVLKKR